MYRTFLLIFTKNVQNAQLFESESYISSMDKPPFVTSLPRNNRRFISVTFSSNRAGEYFFELRFTS